MHRFYLPPGQCREASLVLTGSETHHALHVLRLGPGEKVVVLDGAGVEYLCEVASARRNEVVLQPLEKRCIPPLPCQTTLLQALPKGKLFESIVQKATELGVAQIVPLLAERVVKQPREGSLELLTAKWQAVAVEAVKQCGSPWLPKVEPPITPTDCIRRKDPFDLALVASLQPGSRHPRQVFEEFQQEHQRNPKSICVWIGPEGDFTPGEIQMIVSAGAHPITLGRLVLRTETAAIYCLSIVNYELQVSTGAL